MKDYINIIAIILAPVIAVFIGQYLQDRSLKRQDKMNIFKTLMMTRGLSWDYQMVAALNVIDIVFSKEPKVIEQWHKYYKTLCANSLDSFEIKKREEEKIKLLEEMAKALNYKNIDWSILQNPYIPNGMVDSMNLEWNLKNNQNVLWGLLAGLLQNGAKNEAEDK